MTINRPRFHFTPKKNWMNDPNGLFWHDGKYHLYFQHNPYGTRWGHMSWGHATSPDLIHWEEHEVAILEDPEAQEAIFSGSAVVDSTDVLGAKNAVVAFYTAHTVSEAKIRQVQKIAISSDGGWTFTKKPEPILKRNTADFRDPKVFPYFDEWRMVVAHSVDQKIEILGSKDLINWESLGFFTHPLGNDVVWECPDLIPLELDGKEHWVLLLSINPGGPLGGSGTIYFVGEFDGASFTPKQAPLPLDHGPDNYAGVTFNHEPNNNRILIAWMGSWSRDVHPELEYRGAMTIPRSLGLMNREGQVWLTQEPIVKPNERHILTRMSPRVELLVNEWLEADFASKTVSFLGYSAPFSGDQISLDILRDTTSIEIFSQDRTLSLTYLLFDSANVGRAGLEPATDGL